MANKKSKLQKTLSTLFVVAMVIWWLLKQLGIISGTATLPGTGPVVVGEPGRHLYAGLPVSSQPLTTIERIGYSLGYDEENGVPVWVGYRFEGGPRYDNEERPSRFSVDEDTRARISHDDYTNSGYDRGHMAPNYGIATRYGREAQLETFLMSNIIPQAPELNRGVWRELEEDISGSGGIAERMGEVWVITGPVLGRSPQTLPGTSVAIPEACYKIVLDEEGGALRALAFLFPQDIPDDVDPADYLTTIDEIESRTGLDFLSALPDEGEAALESARAAGVW